MNRFKRFVASAIAVASIGAMSISAFAVDYKHYAFDLSPSSGSYAFSASAEKQDNADYAMARCTDGNVTDTRFVNLSVYKSNSYLTVNCVSEPTPVTCVGHEDDNYKINYNVTRGAGSKNYLCASTGYYSASVKGRWDP